MHVWLVSSVGFFMRKTDPVAMTMPYAVVEPALASVRVI